MANKDNNRLGKGLEAIFGESLDSVLEDIQHNESYISGKQEIEVDKIKANPYQPRVTFDEKKIKELAESISIHGVFTPILVKKSINGYELVAGERRLRASKLANKETIPAIIVDFSDTEMMEIALLENIQRENLNAIEEALGYKKLIDKLNYTQEEVATRIGKSREYVTNLLRLLKLPKEVQDYVVQSKLSMGHVRALLSLEDKDKIKLVAKKAIDEKLSVRNVESLVKEINNPKTSSKSIVKDNIYADVEKLVEDKLQTKVNITNNNIQIKFRDTNDLNRILEILDCLEDN